MPTSAPKRQGLALPVSGPLPRLKADLASGALTEVLADFRPAPLPLSLLYPSNRQLSARVQVFIDWVTALMKPPRRSRHPEG